MACLFIGSDFNSPRKPVFSRVEEEFSSSLTLLPSPINFQISAGFQHALSPIARRDHLRRFRRPSCSLLPLLRRYGEVEWLYVHFDGNYEAKFDFISVLFSFCVVSISSFKNEDIDFLTQLQGRKIKTATLLINSSVLNLNIRMCSPAIWSHLSSFILLSPLPYTHLLHLYTSYTLRHSRAPSAYITSTNLKTYSSDNTHSDYLCGKVRIEK